MSTDDPTASQLKKSGELDRVRVWLKEDFDRARDSETAAIGDFDKAVWLANAGAATVSIGYITAGGNVSLIQFLGACAFVLALGFLLISRFTGEFNASRDRSRRQGASDRFFTQDLPMSSLQSIRDKPSHALKWFTLLLRYSAGVLFLAGCMMTLAAFYPGKQPGTDHGFPGLDRERVKGTNLFSTDKPGVDMNGSFWIASAYGRFRHEVDAHVVVVQQGCWLIDSGILRNELLWAGCPTPESSLNIEHG